MNYIVLDLEWNQGAKSKKTSPLSFEIIEIGAVKLDDNLNYVDSFHRIICPVIYPKLFSYTKKLIPLTEDELKNGIPFKKACLEFLRWCKKEGDYIFATWGTLDLYELQKNMEFYKIKNPFSRPLHYLDVQFLYNLASNRPKDDLASLEHAAISLNLPITKAFHSAKNDAEYTALILKTIPKSFMRAYPSVDIFKYPIYGKQEAYIRYPGFSIYVSRAYKTREALKLASSLRPLYCPLCNKKAKRLTPWYNSGSKSFYILGKCRVHGFLKAKYLIKNPTEKRFFEVLSTKMISDAEKEHFLLVFKTKEKKKNRL